MNYVYEYAVFLAEAVTIVVAVLVVAGGVLAMNARQQGGQSQGFLKVEKLNDRIRDLRHTMESSLLPAAAVKKQHKAEAKSEAQALKKHAAALKKQEPRDDAHPERVFVLRFEGDLKASHIQNLRNEVSAVLTMACPRDEVVVCVESPGGMVHSYGLAASQLTRIRAREIPLTVVVDKIAASGGYLMAAVAHRILAAPFALVGSIGVVAQIPNVHRLLKKNDVDVEVLTAGKHKRTMTVLGENTEEGRKKFVEELEDVHALFQEFVGEYRPQLDMSLVATGEAWYGRRALDHKLVDELTTSDDYLVRACDHSEVYEVTWEEPRKPIERLLGRVNGLLENVGSLLSGLRGGGSSQP